MNDTPTTVAIERLVPHRGGMLWLDRVLHVDEDLVVAEAVVRDDHPLLADDAIPAFAGLEYMAQAIAAWAGARALARGEPARPGFLLGTRRFLASVDTLPLGTPLRIEARRELFGDNGVGLFACVLSTGGTELATANVSVFEPPDADAFLKEHSA